MDSGYLGSPLSWKCEDILALCLVDNGRQPSSCCRRGIKEIDSGAFDAVLGMASDVSKPALCIEGADGTTTFSAFEKSSASAASSVTDPTSPTALTASLEGPRALFAVSSFSSSSESVISTPGLLHASFAGLEGRSKKQKKQGWTELMIATAANDLEKCQTLLDMDLSEVHGCSKRGATALLVAAYMGHYEILEVLIAHGADVNAPDDAGFTPLLAACHGGHLRAVEVLLYAGSDPHARTVEGMSCLSAAAMSGSPRIVQTLLENGVTSKDLNRRDCRGSTPLLWCTSKCSADIVKERIPEKSFTRTSSKSLLKTVSLESDSTATSRTSDGSKESGRVKGKQSILAEYMSGEVHDRYYQVAKLLVTAGANVNVEDHKRWTPLMEAAVAGHVGICELLLSEGALMNVRGKRGWTALHHSVQKGHVAVVRCLLASEVVDVNCKTDKGFTPLHWAARQGYHHIVQLLLASGAEVSMTTNQGSSALMWACGGGHLRAVEVLLGDGADACMRSMDGSTALTWAAVGGYVDVCKRLLRMGNVRKCLDYCNDKRWTALHEAAGQGNLEVVRVLVEAGATVDFQDKVGCTPLMYAVASKQVEISQLLVQSGASIKKKNSRGQNAKSIAGHIGDNKLKRIFSGILRS